MQYNKIAICGFSGFIGKNLQLNLRENYQILNISLRDSNWKNQLVQSDVIINLVGKAHDHNGEATEDDFYYANVELTKQIFDTFVQSGAKLFIHISSVAALEELESNIHLQEDDNCNPSSYYGKSKRTAEQWLSRQEKVNGKKVIILRPPMIHGLGDKGNLELLYKLVSKGIPYPLGSFNNNRSFLSIDNFNFIILKIIRDIENINPGIYHIADDEYISTNRIIELIKEIENKKTLHLCLPKFLVRSIAKIGDFLPFPLNTIKLKKLTSTLTVSNEKIKKELGITNLPLTAEQGLVKTIKSFQK